MSADQHLSRDLDRIEGRAGTMLQGVESRAAFMAAGFRALPLLAAVPAVFVLVQLMRWAGGGEPALLPLPFVVLLSLLAPGIPAARAAAASRASRISRSRALAEADRQLGLSDRLVTADEFMRSGARTGFQQAAVEDASLRSEAAASAALEAPEAAISGSRRLPV